jgi:hypothetical protein
MGKSAYSLEITGENKICLPITHVRIIGSISAG